MESNRLLRCENILVSELFNKIITSKSSSSSSSFLWSYKYKYIWQSLFYFLLFNLHFEFGSTFYLNHNTRLQIKSLAVDNGDSQVDSTEYLKNKSYNLLNESFMFNGSENFRKNLNGMVDGDSSPSDQSILCSGSWPRCLFLSFILGLLIISTIIGNSFVIAAVILERNLQGVANYLIVSLAVADLTVAIMVKIIKIKEFPKSKNFLNKKISIV